MPSKTPKERFESKFYKTDSCWIWTASKRQQGYGQFSYNGRTVKAHRFAYFLYKGIEPGDKFVCHTCDNPSCVNPEHLFLGTYEDNRQDFRDKGRQHLCGFKGSTHPKARLTEEQIIAIRKDIRTLRSIAADYGVHHVTVGQIKRRERWKHI